MEKKDTEDLLGIFEALLSAQLRAVRQLQSGAPAKKASRQERMSHMDMAIDVLKKARAPLHVSALIEQIYSQHGLRVDRESMVSALVKKMRREQGIVRTAPNTFAWNKP
jgi:hypothetical protein